MWCGVLRYSSYWAVVCFVSTCNTWSSYNQAVQHSTVYCIIVRDSAVQCDTTTSITFKTKTDSSPQTHCWRTHSCFSSSQVLRWPSNTGAATGASVSALAWHDDDDDASGRTEAETEIAV